MGRLEISGLVVSRSGSTILGGIDLSVEDGELLVLLGPSAAGKSTLLRAVAGLDPIDTGEIRIDGDDVSDLPTDQRNVAMVFQSDALYPFRVRRNVAFPLEVRRHTRQDIDQRVDAEARALGLAELMDRRPSELSAGEQQLVQIARAMVRVPDLFLMDEPLARLDAALRVRIRDELRLLQRGYGVTTLYVTNDPVEAMAVADRIAVMISGALVQLGLPMEVYRRPVTLGAAEVTGEASVLDVTVQDDSEGFWLVADDIRLRAWSPLLSAHVGRVLRLMIRPDDPSPSPNGGITATITRVVPHGSHSAVYCRVAETDLVLRLPDPGAGVGDVLRLDVTSPVVFDPDTGRRIA